MKISIFKSEFDLMLMLAGTLFQSWIRLENLNLVILSGLGPPKYALDTLTPFVLHFRRKSRFFSNLHWHCLALSLYLYVWTRTKWASCTFILYEQHSLPSRIYCISVVYGFLAWWYWLYTSSWPSRSEFMPSCNFHKTSYKWYNI